MDLSRILQEHVKEFDAQTGPPDAKGCRTWTGYCDEMGCGHFQFRHAGKKFKVRAHRVAFMLVGGELPPGARLRQVCDNPACVEPDHLLLGVDPESERTEHRAHGERNGRAKMSDADVLSLRKDAAAFVRAQADKYGVDESAIRSALAQKTWTRVAPAMRESHA